MDNTELGELEQIIKSHEVVSKDKLEKILDFHTEEKISNNILCRPLLIKSTGDSIREHDFRKLLLQHIIFFVLDFEEYQRKGMDESEFIKKITDLFLTAKSKFQPDNEKTGEIGELILFMILESNNISQIISKMRLKTNQNMPVHGPDAVHVEVRNDNLIFHFGEAKMYQNFNNALDSALESISKIDEQKEDFEFDIIKKYIDRTKFGNFTEKILDYLDPYYDEKENMIKSYPIFIGYDWDVLSDLSKRNGLVLSEYLNNEYNSSLKEKFLTIKNKITSAKTSDKSFLFFTLPFINVNEFRKTFLEMLN